MNSKLWKMYLYIFVCFFAIFLLFPFFKKQYFIRVENQKTKVLKQQIEEQKKKKLNLEKAIKENEDTIEIVKSLDEDTVKFISNIATDKLNEIYSALLQQYIEKHGVIDKAA